ncbi:MAG: diacylglycerol kinase family protein [Deltaproteobacteria bacterium]|nr:diacylglycerol kinase family protein [Deltaproteobacteria bacterium]
MESKKKFTIKARIKSFAYAFQGIKHLLFSQHNAWVHFAITVLMIVLGFVLQLSTVEWCLIVLAMMIVWTAEGMNTAFEFLSDAVSENHHPLIESAKDIAAGAVLIAAIGAVIIGILVLYPHL